MEKENYPIGIPTHDHEDWMLKDNLYQQFLKWISTMQYKNFQLFVLKSQIQGENKNYICSLQIFAPVYERDDLKRLMDDERERNYKMDRGKKLVTTYTSRRSSEHIRERQPDWVYSGDRDRDGLSYRANDPVPYISVSVTEVTSRFDICFGEDFKKEQRITYDDFGAYVLSRCFSLEFHEGMESFYMQGKRIFDPHRQGDINSTLLNHLKEDFLAAKGIADLHAH